MTSYGGGPCSGYRRERPQTWRWQDGSVGLMSEDRVGVRVFRLFVYGSGEEERSSHMEGGGLRGDGICCSRPCPTRFAFASLCIRCTYGDMNNLVNSLSELVCSMVADVR